MTKTYAQLAKEIQALQAQAETLRKAETQGVIAKLNESIARYGLSAEDLHFPGNGASSSTSSTAGSRGAMRPGASFRGADASSGDVKYSDGPGRVWGGRGPRPAWLREAMAQGRSLESFAATDKARGAAGASTPAKVSLPPLYSHPKTGQTWSGRGPKPAWLKQGLKKRGASIDDFLISAREAAATSAPSDATPTPVPQKAATAGRASTSKPGRGVQAKAPGEAVSKSPTQTISKRTQDKASTQVTPTATAAKSTPAPVKKAAAGKSARSAGATSSSSKPQPAAKKATGGRMADGAGARAASASTRAAAPAKKAAAASKAQTDKDPKTAKPAARKTAPARKNLPTSMAPPPAAPTPAPAPSIEPTAAPVPPTAPDLPSAPETDTTA